MGDFDTLTHQRIRIPGAIDPNFALWTPLNVSGCELWFAANKLQGYSNNDAMSVWFDLTEYGYNATQSVSTEKPLYKTNMVNGLPAAYFDNSNDGMYGSVNVTNPYTVIVVYNSITTSGNRRCVQGNSNNWLIGPYGGEHSLYNGAFIEGPTIVANEFVYCRVQGTVSGAEFWVNGSSQGSNGNTTAPGVLNLAYEGAYNEPLNGHIAELIVYDSSISSADALLVENYIKAKYGL